jgi:hypothetical protein
VPAVSMTVIPEHGQARSGGHAELPGGGQRDYLA